MAPIIAEKDNQPATASSPLLLSPISPLSKPPPLQTSPSFPLQSWMGHHRNSIGNLSLSKMSLPGSHNCGSYSVSTKYGIGSFSPVPVFLGFFFERWSKCHGSNLLEQLNAGVRYLDLRVCISHLDDEIRTEHAVYGERIVVMLEHLRTFLENNPEEIVVLFCHKFRAGMDKLEDHDRFLKLMKDVFGEGKAGDIFVKENEFGCSYSELIRKKRRLAFLYGNEEVVRTRGQNWLLSPASCQWDRWYDQPTVEGLKNRIFENRPVIRAAGDDIKLTIAQCILSPTPLMTILGGAISILRFLICNFFAFKRVPQDLMMLAEKANALATQFVSGELGDFKFNVVLLDTVGGSESETLLRSIVGKNVRK